MGNDREQHAGELRLLRRFYDTLEAFGILSPEHQRCQEQLEELMDAVAAVQAAYGGAAVMGCKDEALLCGDRTFLPDERGLAVLRDKLESARVRLLRFASGVTRDEYLRLFGVLLSSVGDPASRDIGRELRASGVKGIVCEQSVPPVTSRIQGAGKRTPWRLVRALDDAAYWHVFDTMRFLRESIRKREVPSVYPIKAAIDVLLAALAKSPDDLLALVFRPQGDDWVIAHAVRSCIVALRLGMELSEDRTTLGLLAESMLLNDIGLFTVPSSIIYKQGPLTEDEQEVVRNHTVTGAAILLTGAGFAPSTVEATLLHHADAEGSGYPAITAATNPSVVCRIVHLVDAYECMIGGRPYRPPRPPFEAAGVLLREAGTTFDAGLVRHFVKTLGLAPVGSLAVLSSGSLAEVLRHNPRDLLRPVVAPLLDGEGHSLPLLDPVDLACTRALTVRGTLPLDPNLSYPMPVLVPSVT
jgi:hypothetical protein